MYSLLVVDDEIRQREAVIKSVDWEKRGLMLSAMPKTGSRHLNFLKNLSLI